MADLFVLIAGLAVGGAAAAVSLPRPRARSVALVVAYSAIAAILIVPAPEAALVFLTVPVWFRLLERGPREAEPSRPRLLFSTLLVTAFLSVLLLALGQASWPNRAPAFRTARMEDVVGALTGPLLPATVLALATLVAVLVLPRERRP